MLKTSLLKIAIPMFLAFPSLLLTAGNADSVQVRFQFIPSKKLVPLFTADTRAHRLTIQRNLDIHSYTAGMGGIFPMIQYNHKNIKYQLSAAGSTYLTLLRYSNYGAVQNTDFFGDLFFDIGLNKNWTMRLGAGHTSQHLIDDAILAGLPFRNYAKDYYQTFAIFQPSNPRLIVYSGLLYYYNFKTYGNISNKIQLQMGFEHSPIKVRSKQFLYYAADIKFRQELNFDHTLNLQLGYKWVSNFKQSMRLALDYTRGADERGYFQPAERNFAHLSLYFDF